MKLINNLYDIVAKRTTEAGDIIYTINLNADCAIYKAHFPSRPITPGVCLVQIMAELAAHHLGCELSVDTAKNIKYLKVVDPLSTPIIDITLRKITPVDADRVAVQATVDSMGAVMTKASFECRK